MAGEGGPDSSCLGWRGRRRVMGQESYMVGVVMAGNQIGQGQWEQGGPGSRGGSR